MTALDRNNEPQNDGAVVAVHYGDYRLQEIWVRSGANIGNWYCLGGEFRRPPVWDDNVAPQMWAAAGRAIPTRPPGTVPVHPEWTDVLARGPVTLLVAGADEDYARGWQAGIRAARHKIDGALEWLQLDPQEQP